MSRYPPAHCGVGEYTRMLVSSLYSIRRDLDILVLATELSGIEQYREATSGAYVYPVLREENNDYSRSLDVLAERNGTDILHIEHEYGIFRDGLGLLSVVEEAKKEKLAKKVIVTLHTVYHPSSGRGDALFFQKNLRTRAIDGIIVHSRLQEFELEAQGVPMDKITRIPHGTLINPYISVPRDKLCKSLGIKGEWLRGIILVTPGFIRPDKGLDVLLNALTSIRFPYTFIVAGEFKDTKIKELVENNSNTIIIEKYLSHDEILKLIALSDILVLPYRDKPGTYSVSGILHLSMGSLRPIIGTRVPRLIELYTRAPRMCVTPGSAKDLEKRLNWAYDNYDLAVAYMSELYAYAARTQWIRMARRHLVLYKKILVRGEAS